MGPFSMSWNFLSQMRLLVLLIPLLKKKKHTKEAWPGPKHHLFSMPSLVAGLKMEAPWGNVRIQALPSTLNNPCAGSRWPPLVLALAYSMELPLSPYSPELPMWVHSFVHSFTSFILPRNHFLASSPSPALGPGETAENRQV